MWALGEVGGDGRLWRVLVYSVQLSNRRVRLMSQRKEVAVSVCRNELTRVLCGHVAAQVVG